MNDDVLELSIVPDLTLWQQEVLKRVMGLKDQKPMAMHPRRAGRIKGFRQRMALIDEYLSRPTFADPLAGVRNVAAKYIPAQHADRKMNAEDA